MRQFFVREHATIDRVGMLLSAACVLHCALIPLILIFGSTHAFGGAAMDEFIHIAMGVVVIPVSGLAFWGGWLRHRRDHVLVIGALGMLLIVVGATVMHDWLGLVGDIVVTTAGSVLLIYAHWQNQACGCAKSAE
ncbi:MAG: MerC domain-containing protein [Pseudomonadota bacterium]